MRRKSGEGIGIFGAGCGEKKMKRIKKALLLTLLVTAALCMMGAGRKKDGDSRTLAEKLEGKYAFRTEEGDDSEGIPDEYLTLEIFNVCGNLYAQEAQAVDYGEGSYDVYSFSAVEIIPAEAGILQSTEATELEAGLMHFSIMSNVGEYWGPPQMCKITLRDGGIEISAVETGEGSDKGSGDGSDEAGVPLMAGEGNRAVFLRDENVPDAFGDAAEFAQGAGRTSVIPEEMYGLWAEKDSDTPMIIEFSEGQEKQPALQIWQKKPGEEVMLCRGAFSCDDLTDWDYEEYSPDNITVSGNLRLGYTTLGSGTMPNRSEPEFFLKENGTLTLQGELPGGGSYAVGTGGEGIVFEKIDENDAPVVALAQPDDIRALRGGMRVRTESGRRDVIPQFTSSNDIENNGGNFVRVGDLVFFHGFDVEEAEIEALWGEFVEHVPELSDGAGMYYYDMRSGSIGKVCDDGGHGPLWYVNGRFCTEVYDPEGENGYEQKVCSFYPDGSGRKALTEGQYAVILDGTEDGAYLCIQSYDDYSCFVTDGWAYPVYAGEKQRTSLTQAAFAGHDLVMLCYEGENRNQVYVMDPETGETTAAGGLPENEFSFNPYPQLIQIERYEDEIWLGLAWYDGTAAMLSGYAVMSLKNEEGSAETEYEGFPRGFDYGGTDPYFYLNYADELLFTEHDPHGEVTLSEKSWGDLLYFDSPFGVSRLVKNMILRNPYDDSAREQSGGRSRRMRSSDSTAVMQCAERVGNRVFVLMADAYRKPENDIGWRMMFGLDSLHYYVIPLDGSIPGDGLDGPDSLEELQLR